MQNLLKQGVINHTSGHIPTFAMQNLLKQGVINHTSGHMPTSTLLSFLCNKKVGI